MAKLMKLQLSGIRSFGPYEEHTQQLKFTSPLTLILGQNGCGKTTIIEAIKYACSGEVPMGTNSGQGFVNDPKMSGACSTKGQIKLKLLDPRGNEVTVSRIVEVSQTPTSLKFTSKSSTIRIVNPATDEDKSISGRCVDVTSECCQIMNVSPAVLNNVIFCHQENSSWPLEEGKKLKERFDDIFDAQKYNRCTDNLKKQWKDKQDNLKLLKVQVESTREKKKQVDKEKRNLQEKEERFEKFENDIRAKNEQLEPVKKRMDEIFELEQVLGDLERELTKKKERKNGVVEEQNTIRLNLEREFEGSDSELQNEIESFESDRRNDENAIAELERRKREIEEKSKQISEAMQEVQTLLGKLGQEKSQYEKKCSDRRKIIEHAKNKMDVSDIKGFNDNAGAQAALYELRNSLENREMCFASLKNEHETEQKSLQKTIDESRESTVRTRQTKVSKEDEIKQCKRKIEDIENQLTMLSTNDDFLKTCVQKIENIDKTLYKLRNSFQETEENKKIDTWRNEIHMAERNLESLESEYRTLSQNEVTEGKIESEKQSIMDKQKEINRLKSKHSDSLKQLFKDNVPERNLKEPVLAMQRNAEATIKKLTESITKKQKEVTTLEVQRQNQVEKIATCEKELKSNREKIAQVCKGKDFKETLKTTFEKKERLQKDKGQYNSIRIIYGQFIRKFEEESPCCPVCETNFTEKSGVVKKIITSLKNKLEKVPQELARVENELEKEENLYSELQQLKFVSDETETLEKEKLPQLKKQLDEINRNLKNNLNELDDFKMKIKEPQKAFDISKNIISDVSSLDQNLSDVEKSKGTIESLKQDLVQVASMKSKQEIEAEIDQLKSEISELRRKIDAQTKKINGHRDRVQQILQEKDALVSKQMRLTETLQSKPALDAQKDELNEKVKSLQEEISELQTNLYLLEAELKNSIENKESIERRNKQHVQEETTKLNNYRQMVQEIEKLQQEIDDYLKKEVDGKLETAKNKLQEYKSKEKTLEETKSTILQAISDKKEHLDQQKLYFVTLKQNIILREKKTLEQQLEVEIENLKKRIGGYNYRTVYEEKRRLMLKREELDMEINRMEGEKNGLRLAIAELKRELELPENKKAYTNYFKKLCELKLAEKVLSDLNIFTIALEKAVLEFHKSKMVQINKHIRQLWRDIYRGNDIDHIEIKTEYASTTSSKKRSYSYKLVQIKRGVELDMRGRCSAGQKVLACLIIRIALAETLSANCGIFALDEPTTNLDRENIHSLSDTLARIVNKRQQEKNFQLLVITHDEEFVNVLTRIQGVSYYYRVLRDNDGFSVIKKENAL